MSHIRWWDDTTVVERFVMDFVKAELALLRPGQSRSPIQAWTSATHLVKDLDLDSLELMSIATGLTQATHLHESGVEDYLLARLTIGEWAGIVCHGLEAYSDNLTFRTSGSTGAPKPCVHSLQSVWQEVEQLAALHAGCVRIVSTVPSHHIYGFLHTVLLPLRLGRPVLDARSMTPLQLAKKLQAGDLLISFPDWWRVASQSGARFGASIEGVTSTAPCPANLHHALRDAGLARLTEIFGSSETGGVGWRDNPAQPYQLFSYWQLDDTTKSLQRHLPDGTSFTVQWRDAMQWHDDRHFIPGARLDDAVQVGGINVFPSRVRAALLEHPFVQDAAVRLMQPQEGVRLKAFIVLHPGVSESEALPSLEKWARDMLTTPELPRAYRFGPCLPLSDTGKLQDWQLATPEAPAESKIQLQSFG
jgi:long-chain acyl-CoA synthetase